MTQIMCASCSHMKRKMFVRRWRNVVTDVSCTHE